MTKKNNDFNNIKDNNSQKFTESEKRSFFNTTKKNIKEKNKRERACCSLFIEQISENTQRSSK